MERGIDERPAGASAGHARTCAYDHWGLREYFEFRLRVALGAALALIALVVPTLLTWFSDNPGAGSAPASGLIDRWSFWEVAGHTQGGGMARLQGGFPSGFLIGGGETALAWLVMIPLLVMVIAVVLTVTRGGWVAPLVTAISGTVALAAIIALRVVAGSDHQGNPGPHSYNTGPGITLALWMTALAIVWALCVMTTVRRDWDPPPSSQR
jgi:hypothetical protein